VNRNVDWSIFINNTLVTSGNVGFGDPYSRANPLSFSLGSGGPGVLSFNTVPGDVVKLELKRGAGSQADYFVGVNLSIEVTRLSPTLTSIRPSSGAPGKTVHVRMSGTNLVPGSTTVQVSGTGVTVEKMNTDGAGSPTSLTAKLTIDPSAAPGPRDMTVTTLTGGTSNAQTFTVAPDASCSVSLPLTAAGSWGNLNITAGIGTSRQMAGNWVVGWMVFNPRSVSFHGLPLFSGTLPQRNPPLMRSLSTRMPPVPAVAVLNAFYNPHLCRYTVTWASTNASARRFEPAPRSQIESVLNSIDLRDFDGTQREIPR
jgi:hypothetical protein